MWTPEQDLLLKNYGRAVVTAPAHLHLTADRLEDHFWARHILEATALSEIISSEVSTLRLLDIGSGNGIPGVPVAIVKPQWQVTMMDSDNKKAGFIDMFCKSHAIKNARVIAGRAEELACGIMRESFDIVTARALAKLATALELAAGFLKIGGSMIVPHGTSWREEMDKSQNAIDELGLDFDNIEHFGKNGEFKALFFHKISSTPKDYPRKSGLPSKKPL